MRTEGARRRWCGVMDMNVRFLLGALALAVAAPLCAAPQGDEPIAVPRTVRQGIDFVYVDPQLNSVARRYQRPTNWLARAFGDAFSSRRGNEPSLLFSRLTQGLQDYRMSWGRLPQVRIPAGAALRSGSTGKRAGLLRTRLVLSAAGGYDHRLAAPGRPHLLLHGLARA